MRKFTILAIFLSVALSACAGKTVENAPEKELTVGVVQKEIYKGMAQADVAEALGSPNIVTKDSEDNESWIYDKIASEASYSNKIAYGTILILGLSKQSGSYSSSQKTLTIVIKFDKGQKVKSFSYHATKF